MDNNAYKVTINGDVVELHCMLRSPDTLLFSGSRSEVLEELRRKARLARAGGLTARADRLVRLAAELEPEQRRSYLGLPLTINEAIGRYLRQIAWGKECADYLLKRGFETWRDEFRASHQRYRERGGRNEWDSWDYSDAEMRLIYAGVIGHALAGTQPDELELAAAGNAGPDRGIGPA